MAFDFGPTVSPKLSSGPAIDCRDVADRCDWRRCTASMDIDDCFDALVCLLSACVSILEVVAPTHLLGPCGDLQSTATKRHNQAPCADDGRDCCG